MRRAAVLTPRRSMLQRHRIPTFTGVGKDPAEMLLRIEDPGSLRGG